MTVEERRPAGVEPLPSRELEEILAVPSAGGRRRRLLFWLGILLAAAVAVALVVGSVGGRGEENPYRTAPVERGDLTVVVSAAGTLQPTNQVEVGSELSGRLRTVEVDFNDRVVRDQVLARLDTSTLEARHLQLEAALEAARARVQEMDATRTRAARDYDRVVALVAEELVTGSDVDAAEAAYRQAEASLAAARAQVRQAEANVEGVEADIVKAVIRSPIDGIVLTRNVEPGQTVAASLQAPVLFTLAEDLVRMELRVDVDEADVSKVGAGQSATFAVDAHPERDFPATILSVRYAPQTVSGVVTYQAVLEVSNEEGLLRPGMTATADIVVETVRDALLVPNAALRFAPSDVETPDAGRGGLVDMLLPMGRRRFGTSGGGRLEGGARQQRVWTLADGEPVPVVVTVGASDGSRTVVVDGELAPGQPLLVGETPASR